MAMDMRSPLTSNTDAFASIDTFRNALAGPQSGTGAREAFAITGSGSDAELTIVTRGRVIDLPRAQTEMAAAKTAFVDALKSFAGDDEAALAKLKKLVDPNFDRNGYLSTASVRQFFASRDNEGIRIAAATAKGIQGQVTPDTPAEAFARLERTAATWSDANSAKFESSVTAITTALDRLKQFEGARLGDTYQKAKAIGQEFINAFAAVNTARAAAAQNPTEATVARYKTALENLEAAPGRIGDGIQKLQKELQGIIDKASRDIEKDRWALTHPRSAAALAHAEMASKALGVIAGAAGSAFGMPAVGAAVKQGASGLVSVAKFLVQWHDTGIGPLGRDSRSTERREASRPLLLADRADRITSEHTGAAIKAGGKLLSHFVGLGMDELQGVVTSFAKSGGAEFSAKWSALMDTLGQSGSTEQQIQEKFADLKKTVDKKITEGADEVTKKFAATLAAKASAVLQGERSEAMFDFDAIMEGLNDSLDALPGQS